MQKSLTSIATRISMLIAFCSCFLFLYFLLNEEYSLSCSNIMILSGCFIVPLCLAGFFIARGFEQEIMKKKLYHTLWMVLFVYYAAVMIYMLFFASEFARDSYRVFDANYIDSLKQQWIFHTNLKPFHTINLMIQAYDLNMTQLANMNLIGNVVAFMPCALFLPKLFPRLKKIIPFTLWMAFMITTVEIIQLLTLSGAMDIDDVILNMAGSLLFYLFLKLPFLQSLLRKYLYY